LKNSVRIALVGAVAAGVFASTLLVSAQAPPPAAGQGAPAAEGARQGGARGGGRGGRGAAATQPAPRLADGTVNFGRVPGEKGTYNVPYITNMADRVVTGPGSTTPVPEIVAAQQARQAAAAAARAGGAGGGARGGGGGGGRGGSKSEPWMPWMPWSAAVYDYNSKNESKYDPEGYCLPPGGPRMMATPYQAEIIQLPEHNRILMVFEGATHIWREIYMDGRKFPEGDELNPTYLGYSVGRWQDKDTLVVENKGFNENTWLDYFGHPHTDLMEVTERWTRPSKQTLHYEATVNDPGAYTRPFTMAWDVPFNVNNELPEYICQENNRYLNRLTDDLGQPIFGPRPQPGVKPAAARGTR
jgi:hypothetical protein